MEVEAKIKTYLFEHKMSQKELSEITHIAIPKLNLTLNGKRRLTFKEYQIICWALGVRVDKFLSPQPPERAS